MLLISWKSGRFSKKDKNAKVRYGEYQYVSTATLTMSEFDPAFIAFIRCRILSLNGMQRMYVYFNVLVLIHLFHVGYELAFCLGNKTTNIFELKKKTSGNINI